MATWQDPSSRERLILASRHYRATLLLVRHVQIENAERLAKALEQLAEAERLLRSPWSAYSDAPEHALADGVDGS